jgi:hypothetical protein
MLPLILFIESLDTRFAAGIEAFLTALLPGLFAYGRCDVPGRPLTSNHKCFRLQVT